MTSGGGRLARSRKQRVGREILCEHVFRPLAHPVVVVLARLRVPPVAVAAGAGATGLAAALLVGQGRYITAALLIQLKTVLDNADGQLARLTDRITVAGRYLDSELDLLVNAALLGALGWHTGHALAAVLGFAALTAVLGVNFNVERLYRIVHGGDGTAMPAASSRVERILRRVYLAAYAPQDRVVEWFVERRLRGVDTAGRRAYHDRATVGIMANLGMSTQLAAFGICLALGHPLAFVAVVSAEVALVVALAVRRELLVQAAGRLPQLEEGAL